MDGGAERRERKRESERASDRESLPCKGGNKRPERREEAAS